MATVPVPRSFSAILGGMLDTFLSRLGLPAIKAGDPSLSIMEAAAQSDFRSTKDIFDNLNAQSLDGASGVALANKGRDARVPRIGLSAANGRVNIGDSSFAKVESRVYQGGTGVTAGSTTISIESAIPANGNLYIGRGTANAEGPIAYTTVVASGSFFIVTLSSPTQNYHQSGESVVYGQGGDRTVLAGTIVSTPATSAGLVVQFRTLFNAVIPDGEVSVINVNVEAQQPGSQSNVPVGALNTFPNLPFAGATVTNPLSFDNGTDTEDEASYKERIRLAEKSRAKATKDAVVYGLVGARALDESGSIISVSTSFRNGEPRTLYIDDGTGYQEKDEGIISESLMDAAIGGEQFFALANRPIAKAYLKTRNSAPFVIVPNSTLTVDVGGVVSTVAFGADAFRDINNASAYEVAAAVNAHGDLPFAARVCDAGSKVALYGKEESQEDLGWVANVDATVTDANAWLQLPLERAYTLYLYKNDVLMYEDGRVASVTSKQQADWAVVGTGATLNITVDGIAQTITFNDIDFANAGTPYVSVSSANTLSSWATVLNYKVPGITANLVGGRIVLTSNLGRNNRANISITGGSLGTSMFVVPSSSTGRSSDFSLDRNSGDVKLVSTLVAGDSLVAGSASTNGFLTSVIGTMTLAASAEFWFVVDGNAAFPVTGISTGTTLTWNIASSPAWGQRVSVTGTGNPWANTVQGDWLIVTDPAVGATSRGIWRIAQVVSANVIHIERPAATLGGATPYTLSAGGVYVVRSSSVPESVTIGAGVNYTPTSLAALFNAALPSITATPVGTSLRIATNSSSGDIAIVAANATAISMGFPFRTIKRSELSHRSYIQTGNSDFGTSLVLQNVTFSGTTLDFTGTESVAPYVLAKFLQPFPDGSNLNRHANQDVIRTYETTNAGTFVNTVRTAAPKEWLPGERFASGAGFDLTGRDNLQLLLDGDTVSGRYNVDLFRKAKIVSTAGGYTLSETNGDSFAKAFGSTFNWKDFQMSIKPRIKSHLTAGADTTKTVLWRWWRHDTAGGRVQYEYPDAPNAAVTVVTETLPTDVAIKLASSAEHAGGTFRTTTKLGVAVTSLAAGLFTYQTVASFAVQSVTRAIRINYALRNATAFAAAAVVTSASGATATVVSDSNAGGSPAATGYIVVTGVVGTFLPLELITTGGGASATTTSSIYGYTEMALTLPGAVTDHGMAVGDTVYSTVANADFVAGARRIDAVGPSKIWYVDTVATTAAVAGIGSLSNDSGGEVTVGAPVVTGDIWSPTVAPFANGIRAQKITLAASGRDWTAQHYVGAGVSTTLTWYSGTGKFYPLNAAANTAAAIAVSVNAVANSPVSAVGVGAAGVATGIITDATYETSELGGVTPWWTMVATTGWIQSHTTPVSPTNVVFTLRDGGLPAILTTNADLANDDVRLVPRTAASVAAFLNATAVSGLANRGGAFVTEAGKVQIHSIVLGSTSAVQVNGGSGNVTGATVQGSANAINGTGIITVNNTDGLAAGQLVWAQNAVRNDKVVFTSGTALTSIAVDGTITVNATKAWTRRNALTDNVPLQIERLGELTLVKGISAFLGAGNALNLGSVVAGDWMYLQTATAAVAGTVFASSVNKGFFRVAAIVEGGASVLLDSPNGLPEICTAKIDFLAYNSAIPGDSVSIGSSYWGAGNQGTRQVKALGATEYIIQLDTTSAAMAAQGVTGILGVNAGYFRVTEAQPHKQLLTITAIAPHGAASMDLLTVLTEIEMPYVNESFGTSIIPLNKLEFPTTGSSGRDSYKRNTGLIAEANRIVFGDETNSAQYAGIASAGASYNINGPLVKRIQVAFAVRPITGVDVTSIRQSAQSAVAAAINKTPIGTAVAISKLIKAIETVNGVQAVSVSSPAYNVGQDQIAVQAYEKALVLDIEHDITISFIGE